LAIYFLNILNKKMGLDKKLCPEVINYLTKYHWPGNVRELKALVEHLLAINLRINIPNSSSLSHYPNGI